MWTVALSRMSTWIFIVCSAFSTSRSVFWAARRALRTSISGMVCGTRRLASTIRSCSSSATPLAALAKRISTSLSASASATFSAARATSSLMPATSCPSPTTSPSLQDAPHDAGPLAREDHFLEQLDRALLDADRARRPAGLGRRGTAGGTRQGGRDDQKQAAGDPESVSHDQAPLFVYGGDGSF